jgi:hypothetical protein
MQQEETGSADSESDLIWGAAAIAKFIRRRRSQVYYMLGTGALDGAVKKIGHRTLVASKKKLSQLVSAESGE